MAFFRQDLQGFNFPGRMVFAKQINVPLKAD